jgi:N-acetyl-anhydromuramyl-L-alanine amidase AmpD
MVGAAAARNGVPADLMLAIGRVEGGLRLRAFREVDPDDHVPVAGVLELRHGAFNSLARGAELMGEPEENLEADLARGTEAGAMVLADLAKEARVDPEKIESWAPVVEKLSGLREPQQRIEYRARVFKVLREGGAFEARDGETIEVPAHEEVPTYLTIPPLVLEPLGTPEFAGAIWFQTDCTNKCTTTRNAPIESIAIHDTEGGWDASVATLQNDPGKSVHYIVDHDGSRVGQFVPEAYEAWHVGNSYYNNRMVGIEHVGFAAQDDYLASMYEKSAELVRDIAQRHGIKPDRAHLIAHQEVPDGTNVPQSAPPCTLSPGACIASNHYGGANHHDDPGVNWEWCQYMDLVGQGAPDETCKCNDTFQLWNCVHDLSMMNRCVNGQVEIVHCAEPCVVEPIGTDDHCVPVMPTGASSSSTGGGAGGEAATTTTASSSSGAGGAGGGGADDGGGDGCGCEVPRGGETPQGLAILAGATALSIARLRRAARGRLSSRAR